MSHSRAQPEGAEPAEDRQLSSEREIIRYTGNRKRELERWMQHFPFPEKYDYVLDHENPDIIALSEAVNIWPYFFRWRAMYRTVLKYRRRYGENPVIFHLTSEAKRPSPEIDFTFSCHPTNRKNCLRSFVLGEPAMQSLWSRGGGGGR